VSGARELKDAYTEELVDAAQNLVNWLEGYGRTNKPRRGRVPAKLLLTLEDALANLEGPW